MLIICLILLVSCGNKEEQEVILGDGYTSDNGIDEWDIMEQGWRPPGRFNGPREWAFSIQDIDDGIVEFVMTFEIAHEIGVAVLKSIIGENLYEKYSIDTNINDNVITITGVYSNSAMNDISISVEIDGESGQILGINNNYSNGIDFEITQEIALAIGDIALFRVMGENRFSDSVFSVTELPSDNCFIVNRTQRYPVILGGCLSVAIDRSDGRIIKIFQGE